MKERPILFSAPMVRAILNGSKTQTRRICKPVISKYDSIPSAIHKDRSGKGWIAWYGEEPPDPEETARLYPGEDGFKCPHGKEGDQLWVRESWRLWEGATFGSDGEPYDPDIITGSLSGLDNEWLSRRPIEYRADTGDDGPWRPSIHMPRWASRISLEIVNVRVERLQDISEEDAIAEGIIELSNCTPPNYSHTDKQYSNGRSVGFRTGKAAFQGLWESINREGSWAQNPWVFVIEFRRIKP